ncbi:MAG: transposase [Anaerolinea sp.]|nr:transposase [Anaerolinea sp.]
MDNHSKLQNRRSTRIPGYDYTLAGTYFITVVTKAREHLFGEITNGKFISNALATIIREEWERTAVVRPGLRLDAFIVMPDHVHGMITILDDGGGLTVGTMIDEISSQGRGAALPVREIHDGIHNGEHIPHAPPPGSIGAIVGQFKSITTKRINVVRKTPGMPVWQRNFFERIIRDERDYQNTVSYLLNNPKNWVAGKTDW